MKSNSLHYLNRIDWGTILLMVGLTVFGWMNIYGATYSFADQSSIWDFKQVAGKQLMWIAVAFVVGFLIFTVNSRLFSSMAYVTYGVWFLVLVATRFLAKDINGSYSWISLGSLGNIQPAEFAKYFTALALSRFMSRYDYKIKSLKDLIIPALLIFVPMGIIIVLQKETGSALVFLSFLLMFYREGMTGYVLLIGVAAVLIFILAIRLSPLTMPLGVGSVGIMVCCLVIEAIAIIFIFLQSKKKWHAYVLMGVTVLGFGIALIINIWTTVNYSLVGTLIVGVTAIYIAILAFIYRRHEWVFLMLFTVGALGWSYGSDYAFQNLLAAHQRTRIEVTLGMKEDKFNSGYNVHQAQIAIGSGGFIGKGYLQGTQTKLKFVPEQHTDFIFCTVGEEWGFVGCSITLLVFVWLILRILKIAERQQSHFSRIYGYCVASILIFHVTINVGMVIGLLPVIGIPLPFFSYGGSSLLGFTILICTLLRLDAADDGRDKLSYL